MYQLLILLLGCVLCSSQDLIATIRLVEDATVALELTNSAPYGVALLRWNLPLDDRFESESFRVLYQGEAVTYIGPRVKYAGPVIDDYVFFMPNETKVYIVRLENAYDFSQVGEYDVVFVDDVMDYGTDDSFHSLPHSRDVFTPYTGVISNSLKFSTTKALYQKILRAPYPCTSGENSAINTAYTTARGTMIVRALETIRRGSTSQSTEWFGAFLASRHTHAENVIRAVSTNTVFRGQCDNQANVYAYVYATDTAHNVYFCSSFWPASNAGGFDTKAGTVIHELSHFNNVGQTGDYVYGTGNARNLARSNPGNAVRNADNYEYFSEQHM